MKRSLDTTVGLAGLFAMAGMVCACSSSSGGLPRQSGAGGGASGSGGVALSGGNAGSAGSGGSTAAGGSAGTGGTTTAGGSGGTGGTTAAGGSAGTGGSRGGAGGGGGDGGSSGGAGGGTAGTGGVSGTGGAGGSTATPGAGGMGSVDFAAGEIDPPTNGGTILFQGIGAPGSFPSRRDPAVGPCDFNNTATCCQTKFDITGNQLTPWDEDLIWTLRGPVLIKQLAVYQPDAATPAQWSLVTQWDSRTPTAPLNAAFKGNSFKGNNTETAGFAGAVSSNCLVNFSTGAPFQTGTGSVPFCPANTGKQYWGWKGSKLFVILSASPPATSSNYPTDCRSNTSTTGWYDAPWFGLSHGELIRPNAFGSCHCYQNGNGCGQFNVFEVVNDGNQYANFDVFSTNFFGYQGYVGEGPCGSNSCKASLFPAAADLIKKSDSSEQPTGVVAGMSAANKNLPVGAAFRRPKTGYRYFVILLDVDTRQVQLAVVHPQKIPPALAPLLPALPAAITRANVDALLALRLPK
jgi:hypothetical protein